ncbi:MAG: YgiQ family radical SAM protein [Spirochaetia bacterium]|nr:YgiQ family radical SAM protein [Spirochaetia bacterium]
MLFLPTTRDEMKELGYVELDVILVTGDTYIDSPYIGAAMIGKYLHSKGYRVGIIAQPDIDDDKDISRLGEPLLFWGVTGGSVDSMVANYTASDKRRQQDDFTPGEKNDRRPDRAVLAYTNLIRRFFKNTRPIVLGGIEASLRRITHFDYWSNSVRRPVLFDAKADYLVYGMGEKAVLKLADAFKRGIDNSSTDIRNTVCAIKGVSFICNHLEFEKLKIAESHIELASFEHCSTSTTESKKCFIEMFGTFYNNNEAQTSKGLYQKVGDRYLVQNPPQPLADKLELDSYYDLSFERDVHPFYASQGKVRALDTIRFSITTHRGCYGECNFCAITVHQGRTILSRSEESILKEAASFTSHPKFHGVIADVGGPTANMYGYECTKKIKAGVCDDKRCVFPKTCETLKPNHFLQLNLLKKLKNMSGVKHIFIASGIRYDLIMDDYKYGHDYLREVVENHTSGQLKIAPEHTDKNVLKLMGKPDNDRLGEFVTAFEKLSNENSKNYHIRNINKSGVGGKKKFLTYYFIAAHPGCSEKEMKQVKEYTSQNLGLNPEQVQIFTPTPSTWSSIMYYTGFNPFQRTSDGFEEIFVEKNVQRKIRQKEILTAKHY